MPFNKNVDTSGLTPEQLYNAEQMSVYAKTPEMRRNFNTVSLAETLLGHLIESEHRLPPVEAFQLCLKYAEHAQSVGEEYMHAAFNAWLAEQPTVEVEPYAPDDVSDLDAAEVTEVSGVTPIDEETITRDAAVADTAARQVAGETVTDPVPATEPAPAG